MNGNKTTRERVLAIILEHRSPDSEVDCDKLAEAVSYSSLQFLAVLKGINEEFGTSLTVEDLQKAQAEGGLQSLLPDSENVEARERLAAIVFEHIGVDSEVDYDKLAEALSYSSLQSLAALKGINEEFGTSLTVEDLENARDKGGLLSLLP